MFLQQGALIQRTLSRFLLLALAAAAAAAAEQHHPNVCPSLSLHFTPECVCWQMFHMFPVTEDRVDIKFNVAAPEEGFG